jgi:hypothetical protein
MSLAFFSLHIFFIIASENIKNIFAGERLSARCSSVVSRATSKRLLSSFYAANNARGSSDSKDGERNRHLKANTMCGILLHIN